MNDIAIGYEAARPALARIAELENALIRQAKEITRLRTLLAIVEPADTLVRLPDGGEIPAEDHVWCEAINITLSRYAADFQATLDEIGLIAYARGGV